MKKGVGFWSKVHDIPGDEGVVSVVKSLVTGLFGIDISCQGVGDRLRRSPGWLAWCQGFGFKVEAICDDLA